MARIELSEAHWYVLVSLTAGPKTVTVLAADVARLSGGQYNPQHHVLLGVINQLLVRGVIERRGKVAGSGARDVLEYGMTQEGERYTATLEHWFRWALAVKERRTPVGGHA